jgi:hypothetical protein
LALADLSGIGWRTSQCSPICRLRGANLDDGDAQFVGLALGIDMQDDEVAASKHALGGVSCDAAP